MNYNPNIHHRRSIRIKDYDYSLNGLYFITICVQDRACLFGDIIDGEMVLNESGIMIEKWYNKTRDNFENIECLDMIIMPNHFHCVWKIDNDGFQPVGADPRVCPNNNEINSPIYKVVQWFKTMTTNEYIHGVKEKDWVAFNKRLWQRNYYEHIIRNNDSYNKILNYINTNPIHWNDDVYSQ